MFFSLRAYNMYGIISEINNHKALRMNIKFSPPDITQAEIDEVADTLRSGWITTGPKTKLFEKQIAAYCGVNRAVCLNSATAGLELILRIFGIGAGDEVITSAYTYTASASVIEHVGAKIVLCDIQPDSWEMDYDALAAAITPKTKAVILVDIAGKICDYDRVRAILESKRDMFRANNELQNLYGRVLLVADAAHSFGAVRDGKPSGKHADFTSFSFHAVKNLTTAEGGAVVWQPFDGLDDEAIYHAFMLWSLHGQSKDALAKNQLGAWEYDIKMCGQKCNMTDIMASIGIVQLRRYAGILARRQEIIDRYTRGLADHVEILAHSGDHYRSSGHLFITRVPGASETQRNAIIIRMAEQGIATNVHYKPLPMHTAYRNLGFDIQDYPQAYARYCNEITLPLHTLLTDQEVDYVIEQYQSAIKEIMRHV